MLDPASNQTSLQVQLDSGKGEQSNKIIVKEKKIEKEVCGESKFCCDQPD